jgi:predicted GNAT family N-acyltransferase
MLKANTDGVDRCVVGYFVDNRLEGMALIQDSAQKLFICGAVWHLSLGAHWAALGPIGVSESQRGGGHGGRLLQGALAELKHRGGRRCRIDWTTLTEFYGKYGFTTSQTYETFDLALRP